MHDLAEYTDRQLLRSTREAVYNRLHTAGVKTRQEAKQVLTDIYPPLADSLLAGLEASIQHDLTDRDRQAHLRPRLIQFRNRLATRVALWLIREKVKQLRELRDRTFENTLRLKGNQ